MKSHVDKEAFFEQTLPGIIQKHQITPAVLFHLLLPELALLFVNSSTSGFHCSILRSIFSIVTSFFSHPGNVDSNIKTKTNESTAVPLRLFSEVLAFAFDSSDRALRWVPTHILSPQLEVSDKILIFCRLCLLLCRCRFVLLSQLCSVQHLLQDSFFAQTWTPLILGLEDSASPIRASTARVLALYASRMPHDSPIVSWLQHFR